MSAPVLLLFGLAIPTGGPPALERSLARLEQEVVRVLALRGFEVRPAQDSYPRPSSADARPNGGEVAAVLGAHRVVVLDLAPSGRSIWVTHHLRAVPGAWDVREVPCTGFPELECPGLLNGLLAGLRQRTHLDVDLSGALRSRAPAVTRCVRAEDRRPLAERIFGRVDLDLEVGPGGRARVRSVAPARVARAPLGACLREALEDIDVGPFEGPPIALRIPVDL